MLIGSEIGAELLSLVDDDGELKFSLSLEISELRLSVKLADELSSNFVELVITSDDEEILDDESGMQPLGDGGLTQESKKY